MQLPQFQVHAALEEDHWWFRARRAIMQELLTAIYLPSKDIFVLDVGCGTGGNTQFMSTMYTCIGVDPSSDAISYARQRYPHLQFLQGYAPQDVREQFGKADIILLMDVLEHVEDDVGFMHSLYAAMKPGAHLLTMAPADPTLAGPHDIGFEHYRRYDMAGFQRLWEGQPIEPRMVSYCNSRLYYLVKLMRWLSRVRGQAWGGGDTDIFLPPRVVNSVMTAVFAGEKGRLKRVLKGNGVGYSKGVSVMALLKKL